MHKQAHPYIETDTLRHPDREGGSRLWYLFGTPVLLGRLNSQGPVWLDSHPRTLHFSSHWFGFEIQIKQIDKCITFSKVLSLVCIISRCRYVSYALCFDIGFFHCWCWGWNTPFLIQLKCLIRFGFSDTYDLLIDFQTKIVTSVLFRNWQFCVAVGTT